MAVWLTYALFTGTLKSTVPVTLTSDRAGLVMETNAKVKLRGVQVGRVADISVTGQENPPVALRLEIDPDKLQFIPANVEAQIRATTIFGAKFVDLVFPDDPSQQRLEAGQVLQSRNVTTEVNTVFENLVAVLDQIDAAKLNSTLSALADGVRGQGERIGQATTDANEVLLALNPRNETITRRPAVAERPSTRRTALRHRTSWRRWTRRARPAPPWSTSPKSWMRCCCPPSGCPTVASACWRPARPT